MWKPACKKFDWGLSFKPSYQKNPPFKIIKLCKRPPVLKLIDNLGSYLLDKTQSICKSCDLLNKSIYLIYLYNSSMWTAHELSINKTYTNFNTS